MEAYVLKKVRAKIKTSDTRSPAQAVTNSETRDHIMNYPMIS